MPKVTFVTLDFEKVSESRIADLLTVEQFCKRLGVSNTIYAAMRHGEPIGLGSAQKVARRLRVPLRSLLSAAGAVEAGGAAA